VTTKWLKTLLMLGLSLNVSTAFAGGDGPRIEPIKTGNIITVDPTTIVGDFFTSLRSQFATSNFSFEADSSSGPFGRGNILWFEGVGSLRFWNGSAWVNNTPAGESVRLVDAVNWDAWATFSSTGVTNPRGTIGDFDTSGNLHAHPLFSVRTASGGLGGSVGAYWISLKLLETTADNSSVVLAASSPLNIVFNRGLSAPAYASAVAAVPVPAAAWLFGSALAGVIGLGRRRSLVSKSDCAGSR